MFLTTPGKLKKAGVIGMNHRNVVCIARNNPRRFYPRVDNKLLTKILVREAGIAAPDLIGVVKTQGHVRELKEFLAHEKAFVIKPAKGSGGKGILVITGRDGEDYLKPSGERVTHHDVCKHASNTLSGLFSLGGNNDVAMIEELVDFDPIFDGFSFQGVPDIRIILYKRLSGNGHDQALHQRLGREGQPASGGCRAWYRYWHREGLKGHSAWKTNYRTSGYGKGIS